MLVNNSYLYFLKINVIKFDLRGEITEIIKLPSSLNSHPIIVKQFFIIFEIIKINYL